MPSLVSEVIYSYLLIKMVRTTRYYSAKWDTYNTLQYTEYLRSFSCHNRLHYHICHPPSLAVESVLSDPLGSSVDAPACQSANWFAGVHIHLHSCSLLRLCRCLHNCNTNWVQDLPWSFNGPCHGPKIQPTWPFIYWLYFCILCHKYGIKWLSGDKCWPP